MKVKALPASSPVVYYSCADCGARLDDMKEVRLHFKESKPCVAFTRITERPFILVYERGVSE